MKRFLKIFTVMVAAVSLASCLKNQDDVFDEPGAIRMQEAIKAYKDTLGASTNGWILQYYPNHKYVPSIGGLNYWLKFDNDQTVEVWTNYQFGGGKVTVSLYDIISDQGPVLTFNTYNNIMHYFTTPSSNFYQGAESDYEFVILGYSDGCFKLKGRKYGSIMYLNRIEDSNASTEDAINDYFQKAMGFVGKIIRDGKYYAFKGADTAAVMMIQNYKLAFVDYSAPKDTISELFTETAKGYDLQHPVEVAGWKIRRLVLNYDEGSFDCIDEGAEDARFVYTQKPDFYKKYDEYLGDYWFVGSMLTFDVGGGTKEILDSVKVTLNEVKGHKYYTSDLVMKKGSDGEPDTPVTIKLQYDPFFGCICMMPQPLDYKNDYYLVGETGKGLIPYEYATMALTEVNEHNVYEANYNYSLILGFKFIKFIDASRQMISIHTPYDWRLEGRTFHSLRKIE
ncbi:MAG: DUF4302 domain-containing protein [Bacteroidales bacterium]|nr:DUF4302 domain-containing protein [Bacteroidales bacterium]